MKRWYSGGWQNFLKHKLIIFKKPAAALELSLMYIEGMAYAVLLFFFFFMNPIMFFKTYYPVVVVFSLAFAIYGAIKTKRPELILYSFFYPLLTFINAYVFIQEFVREIILRKKQLVRLKADRIKL